MKKYDYIIIWSGFYWMHTARFLWNKWFRVAVLEKEWDSFTQASYINQARVHNWYHYPRSYQTAIKSKEFFKRFNNDFGFAINKEFKKIYAIAEKWSKTNSLEFEIFCKKVWIPCKEINKNLFFKKGVEKAYETLEYAFDAIKIRDFMKEELKRRANVDLFYYYNVDKINNTDEWIIVSSKNHNTKFISKNIINATYEWINKIHKLFNIRPISIKYEYTEMILCDVSKNLRWYWLTLMDGEYFSIMPFGIWWKFSLSHVKYTPHEECLEAIPNFKCNKNEYWIPKSNFYKILEDTKKYLNDDIEIKYEKSLYTTKVILSNTEYDDARPTFLQQYELWNGNNLITIFSWKINTIYEIEDYFNKNIFK